MHRTHAGVHRLGSTMETSIVLTHGVEDHAASAALQKHDGLGLVLAMWRGVDVERSRGNLPPVPMGLAFASLGTGLPGPRGFAVRAAPTLWCIG